ncbi:MAG TPA: hypothetical protein VFF58_00095 [Candidatus Nitrosotalea sp.]|nr:hypothetical protein [Candidatus Nitrosotalea sp.]
MQTSWFRAAFKYGLVVLALILALPLSLWGQQNVFAAALTTAPFEPVPAARPAAISFVSLPETPRPHRFWDAENSVLFGSVAALGAADFCVTRANLARGGKELNPVARMFTSSTPALAANFSLETGGVIGVSYLFHKTGHHKLERLTSVVNIGASGAAIGYGLSHR